jgi:hypothetical protein
MDVIRSLGMCVLLMGCMGPATTSAQENFIPYADSAVSVYSKFTKPSVQASRDYWQFVTNRWKDSQCRSTEACIVEGKEVGEEYAKLMKVQLTDEIR